MNKKVFVLFMAFLFGLTACNGINNGSEGKSVSGPDGGSSQGGSSSPSGGSGQEDLNAKFKDSVLVAIGKSRGVIKVDEGFKIDSETSFKVTSKGYTPGGVEAYSYSWQKSRNMLYVENAYYTSQYDDYNGWYFVYDEDEVTSSMNDTRKCTVYNFKNKDQDPTLYQIVKNQAHSVCIDDFGALDCAYAIENNQASFTDKGNNIVSVATTFSGIELEVDVDNQRVLTAKHTMPHDGSQVVFTYDYAATPMNLPTNIYKAPLTDYISNTSFFLLNYSNYNFTFTHTREREYDEGKRLHKNTVIKTEGEYTYLTAQTFDSNDDPFNEMEDLYLHNYVSTDDGWVTWHHDAIFKAFGGYISVEDIDYDRLDELYSPYDYFVDGLGNSINFDEATEVRENYYVLDAYKDGIEYSYIFETDGEQYVTSFARASKNGAGHDVYMTLSDIGTTVAKRFSGNTHDYKEVVKEACASIQNPIRFTIEAMYAGYPYNDVVVELDFSQDDKELIHITESNQIDNVYLEHDKTSDRYYSYTSTSHGTYDKAEIDENQYKTLGKVYFDGAKSYIDYIGYTNHDDIRFSFVAFPVSFNNFTSSIDFKIYDNEDYYYIDLANTLDDPRLKELGSFKIDDQFYSGQYLTYIDGISLPQLNS